MNLPFPGLVRDAVADPEVHRQDTGDGGRGRVAGRAYGGFDIAPGEFSVYSELQVKNGAIAGYVKPLFRGIEVGNDGPGAAEKGLRRRLYEGMVGVSAKILRNRPRGEVATVVPISGRVDRPLISRWEVVGGLLQNAFFKAIHPGFEPQRSPTDESAPIKELIGRDQATPRADSTPTIEAP